MNLELFSHCDYLFSVGLWMSLEWMALSFHVCFFTHLQLIVFQTEKYDLAPSDELLAFLISIILLSVNFFYSTPGRVGTTS